ncbi:g3568 [Coccomyxa viridis]|uniref:G3568 protein n=1 Tax=Coccomyxa viridis TaxID=1274662 RepID=A0ABP1FS41_9CHLO
MQAFIHASAGQFNFTRLAWIGDAVMGMVVTHLVFASTSCADCETLHDRRKVMGCRKMGWEKYVIVGKGYAKTDTEVSMKMRGELFEAVWGAQFVDSGGNYATVMTSYEKNFPLKALAPVFAKIEADRKVAEKARDAAKRAKILAEKAAEKAAAAAAKAGEASPEVKMAESVPQPGKRFILPDHGYPYASPVKAVDSILCQRWCWTPTITEAEKNTVSTVLEQLLSGYLSE